MKLSLRELFLLVIIAAMGCGWWVERQRFTRAEERHWLERSQMEADFAVERRGFFDTIQKANASKRRYDQLIESIIRPFVAPLPDDEA